MNAWSAIRKMACVTKKPRVLFVSYVMPWRPRYGGALRCFGVIRELAKRCDLHVALASDSPGSVQAFQSWSPAGTLTHHVLSPGNGWEDVDDSRASRTAAAILGRGKYSSALQQLERALRPDSVWYFEVESLRRTSFPQSAPAVLDHCDVRWRKQVRYAKIEKGMPRALARAKAAFLRIDDVLLTLRVRQALVASPDEVDSLWPARAVTTVPNGFDFPAEPPTERQASTRLLFYGSLFYKPNADGVRWMCQEIWPAIRARVPHAQLDVVGLGQEALADLVNTPGVTFHGFVDNLSEPMDQAAALVVPLRVGGGTRIKILEAWAEGLPVVSTTVGAEGLAAQDGVTILVGDTPQAFADRCVAILENKDLIHRLIVSGHRYGRDSFDWSVAALALDDVLFKCLNGHSP